MSARRRTSRASIGLLVVGLHVAGVVAWWTAERGMQWVRNNEARLPSIAVWLPALPEPDNAKHLQAATPQQRPQDPSGPLRPHNDNSSSPVEPSRTVDATTAPAAGNGVYVPMESGGPVDAPSPNPTGPALNLNLSRKAITSVAPPSFAEQSPFRGRLPATVERQIATAAAETGPWTEERIDNDHIRFRRGNTCVMMQRPRIATLDPFNEAMARVPWRSSAPEECH